MEKKKKISYDDILASLKMSVNSNGKLEFVRNDKEAIQSSKLTDQINNKYSKPKTNQQMQQQQGQQQRHQQQGKQNLAKQAMQTKHVVRPVQVRYANSITGPNTGPNTRSITGPNTRSNQIPPKQDYLKPYFNIDEESKEVESKEVEIKLTIKEITRGEGLEEEGLEGEALEGLAEGLALGEEGLGEGLALGEGLEEGLTEEAYAQEYHKRLQLLQYIQYHNEQVRIKQMKSRKLLFATSFSSQRPFVKGSSVNKLFKPIQ